LREFFAENLLISHILHCAEEKRRDEGEDVK